MTTREARVRQALADGTLSELEKQLDLEDATTQITGWYTCPTCECEFRVEARNGFEGGPYYCFFCGEHLMNTEVHSARLAAWCKRHKARQTREEPSE